MQGIQITKSDLLDYGLGAYSGDSTSPLNWNEYGLLEFGAYAGQMGIIDGDDTGLLMDFDGDDIVDDLHPDYRGLGLVRNKMLEVAPVDYELIRRYGAPRLGSVALGDDGDVYQYVKDPELGGFFKKIFSKVGGAIKKGVRWVGSKAKQLISKLPGGKYLVKLYDKVYKTSMRLVKPLMRIVGKYAKPLSKIAAFIPGYGPVIAGALHTAGKITDVLKKTGVKLDKKGKPQFKSGKQAKRFKKELKKQAEKMKRKKRKKKEEKKRGKKQDWKKQYKAKLLKKLQREQARKTGRPVAPEQPKSGRLLKAGTPEHKQYLRGLGIDPNLLGN